MAEGFTDAFDAPLVKTMGGREVTLPILELDDLTPIGRRLVEPQRDKALKALPLTATAEQRQNVARFYDDKEADVDVLTAFVFVPRGAAEFLDASLARGGVSEPKERKRLIREYAREVGWRGATETAARVSGLFPAPRQAEGQSPNPPAGQAPEAPSPAATGAPSGSPSNDSPDAPPAA